MSICQLHRTNSMHSTRVYVAQLLQKQCQLEIGNNGKCINIDYNEAEDVDKQRLTEEDQHRVDLKHSKPNEN